MAVTAEIARRETDPLGKSAKEPGSKLDAGKPPVFRGMLDYFPRAVEAVANLSAYGANKYSWKGWEKVPDGVSRYSDAMARHLLKETTEGKYDLDIKHDPKYPADILHATQVAWNALARLELILRNIPVYKSAGTLDVREQMDPTPCPVAPKYEPGWKITEGGTNGL